jgi:hypothetical protein
MRNFGATDAIRSLTRSAAADAFAPTPLHAAALGVRAAVSGYRRASPTASPALLRLTRPAPPRYRANGASRIDGRELNEAYGLALSANERRSGGSRAAPGWCALSHRRRRIAFGPNPDLPPQRRTVRPGRSARSAFPHAWASLPRPRQRHHRRANRRQRVLIAGGGHGLLLSRNEAQARLGPRPCRS